MEPKSKILDFYNMHNSNVEFDADLEYDIQKILYRISFELFDFTFLWYYQNYTSLLILNYSYVKFNTDFISENHFKIKLIVFELFEFKRNLT